jgi:hypothetical protein
MRHSTRLATLCLLVAAAAPLRAQSSSAPARAADGAAADSALVALPGLATDSLLLTAPRNAPAADRPSATAPLAGFQAAAHAPVAATTLTPMTAAARANLGQSRALMIVGAVALVTGAVIGGDPGTLIMVGGAIIGLYGLYEYLQ